MSVLWWIATVLLIGCCGGMAWVFQPATVAWRARQRPSHVCEDTFEKVTASTGSKVAATPENLEPFPSVHDPASVTVSVIVPAYNEEGRLQSMMGPTLDFFGSKMKTESGFTFEVLVVDDGSSDSTADLVMDYVRKHTSERVRLLRLRPNQGKGAAIRKGMLRGRGKYLLMADADGATEISDFDNLWVRLKETEVTREDGRSYGIAVGSRAHLEQESKAKRAFYRTVLMKGMHLCVAILCPTDVKDTQCGFKLFTRAAAASLFSNLHLERWAFDIELIQLCPRLNIPIAEVAVRWQEIEGSKLIQSKLDIITTSLTMLRDMLCVRLCYSLGIWRIRDPKDRGKKVQ